MSTGKYILDPAGNPVPEPDLLVWGRWFQTADQHLADTTTADGSYWISTVFLGLDHNFGNGPPILWETMVFRRDGRAIGGQERYTSREQALKRHKEIVEHYA